MFKLISSNKIIFLGIFLVVIQTFFGASFDTATKFLGSNNNLLWYHYCLLYTSDAADEEDSVDLGGRRIIKKYVYSNFFRRRK